MFLLFFPVQTINPWPSEREIEMIIGTKVIGLPDVFDEGDMEDQFVQVQFDDGTFVNLSEEELRNAAALAEKGCLSD